MPYVIQSGFGLAGLPRSSFSSSLDISFGFAMPSVRAPVLCLNSLPLPFVICAFGDFRVPFDKLVRMIRQYSLCCGAGCLGSRLCKGKELRNGDS